MIEKISFLRYNYNGIKWLN